MASSSAVSAPLRREVLSVYRLVLRAANKAFQGDQIAINEAHKQIRMHFEESRSVSEENEIKELIENAKESAMILDELVVQSQIDESGNLKIRAQPEHMGYVIEPPEVPKPKRRRKKSDDGDSNVK